MRRSYEFSTGGESVIHGDPADDIGKEVLVESGFSAVPVKYGLWKEFQS